MTHSSSHNASDGREGLSLPGPRTDDLCADAQERSPRDDLLALVAAQVAMAVDGYCSAETAARRILERGPTILVDLAQVTGDELAAMARAHDLEDSAQRGETSPWVHYDCEGDCSVCLEFAKDRVAAMSCAVAALVAARAGTRVAAGSEGEAEAPGETK